MAETRGRSSIVMLMLILALCMVSGARAAANCQQEQQLGIKACKALLNGSSPSAACCTRIRVTHFECVCPLITPKLAALIDPSRARSLVQGCGRKLPRNFKCGSITIP